MLNYARTIVAALWDFEVLHSGLLAEPDGLENGVDHGLERGPAIEWGHEASMEAQELLCPQHCFMEWFCNASLRAKKKRISNVPLVAFPVWKPRVVCPIPSTLLRKFFAKTGNGQTASSANMPPSEICFQFVLNVSSQNHVCKLDCAGELFD